MALFIVSLLPFLIFSYLKTRKSFHMLQQNLYNDDNRYLKWVLKNITKIVFDSDILFIVMLCSLFIEDYIASAIFATLYLVIMLLYVRKKTKFTAKKPLVVTARVKRLFTTKIILYLIAILPLAISYKKELLGYEYLILGLITYLNNFVVLAANFINKPVEKMVYFYYRHKAVKKLKTMKVPVIGITGSYGKTSSKNILNDILNAKYNSFATPKSFNTPYGLMNSINNYLDKFDDMFIAEMGAYKIGEIKQCCDLVHPKYGIITIIGEAHLELFGSRDNIMKGKFELVESLPSDGCAVLNMDDPYQVRYVKDYKKSKCKVLWIGIDNKDADLYATNIKVTKTGTTFDCIFKGEKEKVSFSTRLLGKHNVYNVLAGIMLGYELGLTKKELVRGVSEVKGTEHRLELKKYGKLTIIDDAYNSNPVGSKMALEVLKLMGGTKIIVTPGMIELGAKQYELNKEFGKYISDACDYVILIGKKQTEPIYDGLKECKYSDDKIFILDDVREAFPLMNRLASGDTFVLLENDLPDLFNE